MPKLLPGLFLIFTCSPILQAHEQSHYVGSKHPYEEPEHFDYEPAPPSCRAVHIAGIHRHGSRYMGSDKAIKHLLTFLNHAENLDELTSTGKKALEWTEEAERTFQMGMLTAQGIQELRELGERTYEHFSEIFDNSTSKIKIQATFKPRTHQSRDFFQMGLQEAADIEDSRFEISSHEYCKDLSLRYFDNCQRYTNYWLDVYRPLKYANTHNLHKKAANIESRKLTLASLFKNPDRVANTDEQRWQIIDAIYHLCQQDYNLDSDTGPTEFCSLLPQQMKDLSFAQDNFADYYKLGPASDVKNNPYAKSTYTMACMALEPLFEEMRKHVEGDDEALAAFLGFGHAETVVPLGSYFEFFESELTKWEGHKTAQMASNLRFVLYACGEENAEKTHKVKLFYNEREIHFPIQECKDSYYCDWDLVQNYYTRRKLELGTGSCSLRDWNRYCKNPSLDTITCTPRQATENEDDY